MIKINENIANYSEWIIIDKNKKISLNHFT